MWVNRSPKSRTRGNARQERKPTMTAEDTTPSEREAPQRFAWWHPQSADLGRRAEARRQHARRNDLWARPTACEAPIIPRPLPPPSTRGVFAVIDGPVCVIVYSNVVVTLVALVTRLAFAL